MLLAYLGDASKTVSGKYRNGIRSMLRERLLLEAVAKREAAAEGLRQIELDLQFVPLMTPENAANLLRKLKKRIGWLSSLRMMDLKALEPVTLNIDTLAALYDALAKAGVIRDDDEDDDA